MITKSKKNLGRNSLLKIVALLFGYAFWLILAQDQLIQITPIIPLSFYTPENNFKISAPHELTIGITGKRLDLQKLNLHNIGAHIDLSDLTKAGTYQLQVTTENIFLPNYVKLLYYHPVMINLELSESNKATHSEPIESILHTK